MNSVHAFALMADYNQSMNAQMYAAAGKLTDEELSQPRGAFFGSILGSLNHIMVGDIIWLKRFATLCPVLAPIEVWPQPTALDECLYSTMTELAEARTRLDALIVTFAQSLTDTQLAATLSYQSTRGDSYHKNFGLVLLHFFNHQTHHRGQVSTLLNQAGVDVGVTDFLFTIPNE